MRYAANRAQIQRRIPWDYSNALPDYHFRSCCRALSVEIGSGHQTEITVSRFRLVTARYQRTPARWAQSVRTILAHKRAAALRARARALVTAARELRVAAAAAAADSVVSPTCQRLHKGKAGAGAGACAVFPRRICRRDIKYIDYDSAVLCRPSRGCESCQLRWEWASARANSTDLTFEADSDG
jgi:hypothetical protein